MNENHYLVTEQTQGISKDLEHTITIETVDDAEDWFVIAKNKMLDVNAWHKISTTPTATFKLTDGHGKPLHRKAHRGDHIRVETTGDGTGYEWGVIDSITYDDYPDEDMESMAIHVRPVSAEHNGSSDHDRHKATTTVVIERRGRDLSALYHGNSETEPVHEDTHIMPDNLQNIEWHSLIEGMLAA